MTDDQVRAFNARLRGIQRSGRAGAEAPEEERPMNRLLNETYLSERTESERDFALRALATGRRLGRMGEGGLLVAVLDTAAAERDGIQAIDPDTSLTVQLRRCPATWRQDLSQPKPADETWFFLDADLPYSLCYSGKTQMWRIRGAHRTEDEKSESEPGRLADLIEGYCSR